MKNLSKLYFWYSFFPILIGLFVYLCFGSTETKIYKLGETILGHNISSQLRPDMNLPFLVQYHLADGIWAFALTSSLFLQLYKEMDAKVLLLFSVFSFSFYELGQHFDWISGTSDLIDVGFMLVCSLFAFYLLNKKLILCESTSYSC